MVEELPEQRHPGVERRGQALVRRDVRDADVDVALGRGIEVDVVLRQRAGECRTRGDDTFGRRGFIIQDGQIRLVVGDDRLCCRHDLGRFQTREPHQRRRHGGDVAKGLVGNQVRDDARIGVKYAAAVLVVACRLTIPRIDIRRLQRPGQRHQPRHHLIGRAPERAPVDQVVVGAVDRAQAKGQVRVNHQFGQGRAVGMRLGDFDLSEDEVEVVAIDGNHFAYPVMRVSRVLGARREW